MVAVEDALVAVVGGTLAAEEGHTLDAEDGMLAVEGIANLFSSANSSAMELVSLSMLTDSFDMFSLHCMSILSMWSKKSLFYINFFFCKLGIRWQLSL